MDAMLQAYVNEYGEDLANELTGNNNIVEAEVVNDGEERNETGETGFNSENERLDSPSQEEE